MLGKQHDTVPLSAEFSDEAGWQGERDRRVRALEVGTLAMFVIAAAAAYRMWMLGVTSIVVALAVTVLACGLNLVRLRRSASVKRAGNFSIAIFYALLITSVSATGGFYDPNFAWLYAVPLGAAFLVDPRSSCYWAAIVAVTTLFFWQLVGWNIEVPNLVPIAERHGQALFNRMSLLAGLMVLAGSLVVSQRRTERSLASRNRELHLEAQCVQLLQHAAISANEADDFDSAIDACVERVIDTAAWSLGLVWEPASDGCDEFVWKGRSQSASDIDADELLVHSRTLTVTHGELALGRVLATAEPEWASGLQLEPTSSPRGRAALEAGLTCVLAIPIPVRGRVLRIVEFFGHEHASLDQRLIDVLCDVGGQLGRVAERVRLQESVRQSQKLESIGQLAAGIAHEISNPMAYVHANLGMLREEWGEIIELAKSEAEPEKLRRQIEGCEELIGESLDGVDRTVAIVRDVRDFARDGGAAIERVSVTELIESSLRVATSAKPRGATVDTRLEHGLEIECLATRMRQVVLNLVMNAMQAMAEGGTLRIQSKRENQDVIISVKDDGHGILAADRERIFEPFFTTKPAGHGTGLGLYISYEIVRWHGGTIEVDSTPGHGARFTLRLPATLGG